MAKRKRVPGYLPHKARGTAKVIINGKSHYLLGKYGSEESRAAYDRIIAEHLQKRDRPETVNVTINRLCVGYLAFARRYYVKDDHITAEVGGIQGALRPLVMLYGKQPVSDFGSLKLKKVGNR